MASVSSEPAKALYDRVWKSYRRFEEQVRSVTRGESLESMRHVRLDPWWRGGRTGRAVVRFSQLVHC